MREKERERETGREREREKNARETARDMESESAREREEECERDSQRYTETERERTVRISVSLAESSDSSLLPPPLHACADVLTPGTVTSNCHVQGWYRRVQKNVPGTSANRCVFQKNEKGCASTPGCAFGIFLDAKECAFGIFRARVARYRHRADLRAKRR